MGGEFLGVQGIAIAPGALGLEQRGIGVAQQLAGAAGIAGEQADADAGIDQHLVAVQLERFLEAIEDALGQGGRLHQLRATFGQHGELVAAQARQGHSGAEHVAQALGKRLEQLVADVMPEAVVDHLEVIQVDHQHGAAALVDLRRGQGLFGAVGEQQAVGQVGQRIVVGQVRQLVLGILDRADVGEYRHIVGELALLVADRADGLPLRIDFPALASVPDFPAPLAALAQRAEHRLVEVHRMMAGLEHARLAPQHFLALVAGDLHEGAVDVDDLALGVAHQYPFAGTVEHRRGLAQALTVLLLVAQPAVGAQHA